jgi:hypothetical protein
MCAAVRRSRNKNACVPCVVCALVRVVLCTLRGTSITRAAATLARKEYMPKVGVLVRMTLGLSRRVIISKISSDPTYHDTTRHDTTRHTTRHTTHDTRHTTHDTRHTTHDTQRRTRHTRHDQYGTRTCYACMSNRLGPSASGKRKEERNTNQRRTRSVVA